MRSDRQPKPGLLLQPYISSLPRGAPDASPSPTLPPEQPTPAQQYGNGACEACTGDTAGLALTTNAASVAAGMHAAVVMAAVALAAAGMRL
jgi:hypothetical protein